MSGFSEVFTKKQLLEYLDKQIKNDEVVIITTFCRGFSLHKKDGGKSITLQYPVSGFKEKDGIGDIMRQKNVGICIVSDMNIFAADLKKDLSNALNVEKKDKRSVATKAP